MLRCYLIFCLKKFEALNYNSTKQNNMLFANTEIAKWNADKTNAG